MSRRFGVALEFSFLLFLVCAGFAGYFLMNEGRGAAVGLRHDWIPAVILLGIPSMASLGLVLLAMLVPPLIPGGVYQFPLNLTLPLVYMAVLYVAVFLLLTPGHSLQAPPEALQIAGFWLRPDILLACLVVQWLALSLLLLRTRKVVQRDS
jgi:hypothetical protein